MSSLSLTVASWADRDDLVIEIDDGDEQLGLVSYDPILEKPVIELYPRGTGGEWHFDLDEISAMFAMARERILEVAGPEAREAMIAAQAELKSVSVP